MSSRVYYYFQESSVVMGDASKSRFYGRDSVQ